MSAIKWSAEIEFPSDSCFKNRIVDAKFGSIYLPVKRYCFPINFNVVI